MRSLRVRMESHLKAYLFDRKRRYFEAIRADPAPTLAFTGFTTNIDFAAYDLDTPIGPTVGARR